MTSIVARAAKGVNAINPREFLAEFAKALPRPLGPCDVAVHGIIAREWPAVRATLEQMRNR